MSSRFFEDPLRHQVAMVIYETEAVIEFDGGIAVVYFQVDHGDAELFCLVREEFEHLRSNAASPMRTAHEEFIDPGAAAAVFQAVVEGHDDIADGLSVGENQPDASQCRIE